MQMPRLGFHQATIAYFNMRSNSSFDSWNSLDADSIGGGEEEEMMILHFTATSLHVHFNPPFETHPIVQHYVM
jgi:hypothetical protein